MKKKMLQSEKEGEGMKKKHILIIGGTRGTGRVLAGVLADSGHAVSVIGKRQPAENDRKKQGVSYWIVDLMNQSGLSDALAEIVKKNGKLSGLVFLQRYRGTGDAWQGEMDTSLTATKNIIERLTGEFEEGGGSIVIVSSLASRLVAEEQPVGYHVAKAGLNQLAKYYAVTLGPRGIRVNCVSPSIVLKEESEKFYLENKQITDLYKKITPLGGRVTTEEVAGVIEFLCSPKARFITGQDIAIDGGLSLHWQASLARKLANVVEVAPGKK